MMPNAFRKRSSFSDIRFRDPSWIEHEAFTRGLPIEMVKAKPVLRTEDALLKHRDAVDHMMPCLEVNTVGHAIEVVLRKDKPHYYKLPTGWRVLVPVKE